MTKQKNQFGIARRAALAGAAAFITGSMLPRPALATIVDFVVVGKEDWLFAIYDEVRHADLSRIKMVTQTINDAVGVMKQAGIETVVALTPAKSRIYRDFLPNDFQFSADADKRYAMSLDLLRAPGTLVPDLATAMLDQRKAHPDVPMFLKADTHWTGPGAEPAAMELAKQVKAKLRLPPAPKPGTQLGPLVPIRQSANDLADGLPDAAGAKYGPQTYMLHQPIQAGAASLVADETFDVMLVGNSFMQPKYGFAPMLSNQLDRPVSLTWKVHQSSPYKTLLTALGTDEVRQHRPKLVVWNFEETDMLAMSDEAGVWGQNVLPSKSFVAALRTVLGV